MIPMKNKLHSIFLLFALFGIGILNIQSQSVSLDIKKWDGSETTIDINSLKKITFGNGNLMLTYTTGTVDNVTTSTIRKMVFSSITGIGQPEAYDTGMLAYPNPGNDFIALKNIPSGIHEVMIYSVCGTLVLKSGYPGNGRIDISGLTNGIYIIKAGHQAFKFTKL